MDNLFGIHPDDLHKINFGNLRKFTPILPTMAVIKGILKSDVPRSWGNQLMSDQEMKELLSNKIIMKQNNFRTLCLGS